ncbi:MAG: LysR family transcriptional regulator [Oscillospiraceae bacterium]|nr:LysR family transcriptional regulator [Oscillospiraceae bacterium]
MNSLQIKYFLHLCRTHNVSETARQLYVAQPAVSKQIAALERELGFALFTRTNRGVALTPGGEEIYACLSQASAELQRAAARARRRMADERESLNIGILESLGLDELSDALAALRQQSPTLEVNLSRLSGGTLMRRLSEGRLDVAITFDHALEQRTGVVSAELLLDQSIFIISREHPLARKPDLSPADLSGEIICQNVSPEGDFYDRHLHQLLEMLHIRPRGYLSTENLASGLAAVETNLAVGLIDERIQLLHPERFRLIPSGTYQSIICAWMEDNRNPLIPCLAQALQACFV